MSASLFRYQTAPFYRPLVSIHGIHADENGGFYPIYDYHSLNVDVSRAYKLLLWYGFNRDNETSLLEAVNDRLPPVAGAKYEKIPKNLGLVPDGSSR
jgi:hypothetical protein